jgi:hypothetical protein
VETAVPEGEEELVLVAAGVREWEALAVEERVAMGVLENVTMLGSVGEG